MNFLYTFTLINPENLKSIKQELIYVIFHQTSFSAHRPPGLQSRK